MSSKPKSPNVAPDSATSRSYGYVTEIIGAGEIEGVLNERAGIYLNETPAQLVNPVTGEIVDNFKGGTFEQRRGLPNQTIIAGYGDRITSETVVGVEIIQSTPLIRSFVNSELDAISIRMGVQLVYQINKGAVSGAEMIFEVYIQQGSGPFELRSTIELNGKFSNTTEFEYLFPVDNKGGTVSNWAIKIQKLSFDSDNDPSLGNSEGETLTRNLLWQSYSEVINAGITYKNSAYICLGFDAEQFSSIPSRQYLVGGLFFLIPSNSVVNGNRGLNYSGAWDGTFIKSSVTAVADPVWFLYYLLTDRVNGLGEYLNEADIDKWSFYDASIYNNQLVQNGLGGQESRFVFNGSINLKANAWEVLDQICSSFFARRYWSEGTVKIAQDRPGLVQMQFTNSDVSQGQFTYTSTAIDERVNSVKVTWFDPNDLYKETVEEVEDVGLIQINGLVTDEVVAVGTTTRGQAIRYGRKIIYSSNLEIETVNFTSRAIGEYVRIGDLISIADNNRTTARYSGLIQSIEGDNKIIIDTPINIPVGVVNVSVLMPSGTISTHQLTNSPGVAISLEISPSFGATKPSVGSNFVITQGTNKTPIYRVMSKKVVDDNTSAFEITGLLYDESKYDKIENGWLTEPTKLAPSLQVIAIAPSNLYAESTLSNVTNETINVNVFWSTPLLANGQPNGNVTKYLLSYRLKDSTPGINRFSDEVVVTDNEYTYNELPNANYSIRLRSVTLNGTTSNYVYATAYPVSQITDVATFSIRRHSGFLTEV